MILEPLGHTWSAQFGPKELHLLGFRSNRLVTSSNVWGFRILVLSSLLRYPVQSRFQARFHLRLDQRIQRPRTRGESPDASRTGTARSRTPTVRKMQNPPTATNTPNITGRPGMDPIIPPSQEPNSRPSSPGSPTSPKVRPKLAGLMDASPQAAPPPKYQPTGLGL